MPSGLGLLELDGACPCSKVLLTAFSLMSLGYLQIMAPKLHDVGCGRPRKRPTFLRRTLIRADLLLVTTVDRCKSNSKMDSRWLLLIYGRQ